jgi:hypothetical protein
MLNVVKHLKNLKVKEILRCAQNDSLLNMTVYIKFLVFDIPHLDVEGGAVG